MYNTKYLLLLHKNLIIHVTKYIISATKIQKNNKSKPILKKIFMMENYQITDSTPVAILTVGQQKKLFQGWVKELLGVQDITTPSEQLNKRYVYGIAGIASLFNCSYVTAFNLKNGILKPAVFQQGRKIICDAGMAMEIFKSQAAK